MDTFERHESEVRSYCRSFPTVFVSGRGCRLRDRQGREYLDFFAGAGALSHGHNPARLKRELMAYLERDGVTHSLDMATAAKARFLERFYEVVLAPRELDYRVQFPGPTGTNAVEAALKLARKVTGRTEVIAFTNAFHGMTLGSLSITGNQFKRSGAGMPLAGATSMPFDGYLGPDIDTVEVLRSYLEDRGSGLDKPAAIILETVQAEGGVRPASFEWLVRVARLARRHDILLIVDDIQVGCGRTGPFFSFEPADLTPDIVCLSKALSGYGLPLAVTLLRPELDVWEPGEHNGTFRGHNPAFVTATSALDSWQDDAFTRHVESQGRYAAQGLEAVAEAYPDAIAGVRGRGLIQGLVFREAGLAPRVSRAAFERGLVIETAGVDSRVLKLLPPLVIERAELQEGLEIIGRSVAHVLGRERTTTTKRSATRSPAREAEVGS